MTTPLIVIECCREALHNSGYFYLSKLLISAVDDLMASPEAADEPPRDRLTALAHAIEINIEAEAAGAAVILPPQSVDGSSTCAACGEAILHDLEGVSLCSVCLEEQAESFLESAAGLAGDKPDAPQIGELTNAERIAINEKLVAVPTQLGGFSFQQYLGCVVALCVADLPWSELCRRHQLVEHAIEQAKPSIRQHVKNLKGLPTPAHRTHYLDTLADQLRRSDGYQGMGVAVHDGHMAKPRGGGEG